MRLKRRTRTTGAAMLAVALSWAGAGCVSTFENYRVVSFPDAFGTIITKVETYDRPTGWETGGRIVSVETFGHPSIFAQVAGPAAIVYAATEYEGDDVTVANESRSESSARVRGRPWHERGKR